MSAAVLQRLTQGVRLAPDDERLVSFGLLDVQTFSSQARPTDTLSSPGVLFLHEGMAQVYQTLKQGGRQLISLLVPGDFIVFRPEEQRKLRIDIEMLCSSRASLVPISILTNWTESSHNLVVAVEHVHRVREAIAREWLVGLGARSTLSRTAHLFSELRWRVRTISPGDPNSIDLPLSQIQLSQAVGASPVHVNRVLSELKTLNAATLRSGVLTIHDRGRLEALADFDNYYLRLDSAD